MQYLNVKGFAKPVSRLIFGTAWFTLDDEECAHEMMDLYVSRGGNFIDTGRYYGKGNGIAKSEEILFRWLKKSGIREEIFIADKACNPFIDRNGVMHDERWRVSKEFMEEDLNYSLDHVGVDYFDLYMLHRDDPRIPVSELMDTLEMFRRNGLVKTYGVSNWQQSRVQEAMEYCRLMGYYGLSVNSPSYSLAHVKVPRWPGIVYADDHYALWHKDKDISLFAWGAQASGFFAEIPLFNPITASIDVREAYLHEINFERLKRAKELAEEKNVSPTNIALAYVMNQGLPVAAIIGPKNLDELDSSLNALEIILSPSDIEYLSLRSNKRLD
jgi:aryl-alcohol dehydrogenase-like predicted oxidoreductase